MRIPSQGGRAPLFALLVLFLAADALAASNSTQPTTAGTGSTTSAPFRGPDDLDTTQQPCIEGENCVQGPCHLHASCTGNDECVYINADDETYCEDSDGFGGKCLQGECIVQRQAAIKSSGDHLVFHTPTGGDFLFSSSDLSEDLSMRDVATRLSNTEDAAQSLHTRADAIEVKAEGAAAGHQGLVTRVTAMNSDINAQFVQVNTYVGDVEAKADTNADDIVALAAKVASNAGEIDSLHDTATELDGKVAGLESSKATRVELTTAVDDLEDQLQAEAADIRVLQDEIQTKVIKLDDQTTEHNSFIKDMQANIASLGGRVDGNDADITELKQTRLTQAQVLGVVDAYFTPVKDKLEGDIAKLRTDLSAIDLKPLETKIGLNTIVGRIGAGIGPSKTLTETEANKAAEKYCNNNGYGYDKTKVECVECLAGMVDLENSRCLESNIVTAKMTKSRIQSSCGQSWQYGLLDDKPLTYRLKEKSLVKITYNVEVNLEMLSCYNSMYAILYPTIDGTRLTYCTYPYWYQYRYYRYSYHEYLIRRPIICTQIVELDKGEHTIDFDMLLYGDKYTIHHDTSLVTVRALSPVTAAAKAETGKCVGKTAQTLLSTTHVSSYDIGCTSGSTFNINSRFAQSGPWQLSSRTGRVRITFKTRAYVRAQYCYSSRTYDARLQVRPSIDGQSLGYAATVHAYGQYQDEYTQSPILVDFYYDVGVGSFSLSLDGYSRGAYGSFQGGAHWSSLRVEDIPKEERKAESADLPAGCSGLPRRYLIQSYVVSQSRFTNTNGQTNWVIMKDQATSSNKLTFTVLQDQTRVRLYIKVQAYVAESRSYASSNSNLRITPYIDGKTQGTCCDKTTKVYSSFSDYEEGPGTCDMTFLLDEGEHYLQLQHYGRGGESTIQAGQATSLILLEEIVHRSY